MSTQYTSFSALLAQQGLSLTGHQYAQFEQYYKALVAWNKKVNLTAITEKEEVFIKHFYDSLSLSFYFDMGDVGTLADIGSGAGFPGIPLKIMFPHIKLTIVDSLNKRILFLEHLIDQLRLTDVNCIHSRAEDASRLRELRDQFDLVTARAVARLPVLNELCLPFAKQGGYFIAMKGADGPSEIEEASHSLQELKAKVEHVHRFELPVEASARHIIVMKKQAATPRRYPRKAGIPTRKPL